MSSSSKVMRSTLAVLLAAALGACGGEDKAAPDEPKRQQAGGGDCGSVEVTGHEAVEIKASGPSCEAAKAVAAAAEGRGRAPYEQSGFSCTPSPAGGGDTHYACTGVGGRVSFRYGTS